MTARNFSEDGAAGAMTGSPSGSTVGGVTMTDPGPVTENGGFQPSASTGAIPGADSYGGGGWGGGGFSGGSDSGSSLASSSIGSGGGWGGGGLAAPTRGTNPNWSDQTSQTKGWATPWAGMPQDTGGFQTGGVSWGFAEGGAIDEDPNATDPQGSAMGASLQNSINQALATVGSTLSYGRQLHGLGGGQQQAMNTEGFRQSDNVEDRTGNDQSDKGRIANNVSNNSANLVDKAKGLFAADPTKNKMSQDAGINDIGGDGGTAQPGAQQAIPTDDEEEAQ